MNTLSNSVLQNPGRCGRGVAKERSNGSKLLKVIAKRKRTPLGASEPSLAPAPCSKCRALASEDRKREVLCLDLGRVVRGPGQRKGPGQPLTGWQTRTLPQL